MSTHKTTVQRWGNSLAVRIPASVAADANIDVDTVVKLIGKKGSFAVVPIAGEVMPIVPTTLKALLKNVKPYKKSEIIDWGAPVGKEIW